MNKSLASLVPLSFKTAVHTRLNHAKLKRLTRTKKRFRADRVNGQKPSTVQGVNLIAYIRAEMGLGTAARGMAAAFDAAGIPFNIINLQRGNPARQTDYSWSHKEVVRSDFDTTVVCVNPDSSFYLRTQVPTEVLGNRYAIGNWYWELSEMPDAWMHEFDLIDEVWAPSNFIKEAISAKAGRANVPVIRIPPVVQLSHKASFSRAQFGLPEHCFLFLAMFDARSVLQRKNPLGVLMAFMSAFGRNDSTVGLVMKFNNPDNEPDDLTQLRAKAAGYENIFFVNSPLGRAELSSLINACDCFVSLHRSEGFGLGPAEAMSLGKPAIITNWSGTTDYISTDNCVAIDYKLVELGQNYGPYRADQRWAEPNLEQASHWMKKLVEDPELAKEIGARGKHTITTEFSPQVIGPIIQHRLEQIRTGL
jgi:glycosyltransferase involved in cell wall biosynthesis